MFKHPLEPLRTPVLPSTSLPPSNNIYYWTYYSDTMFINGLPVSSLFFYTALLYPHQCLFAHICCTFCSSLRYTFMFLASSVIYALCLLSILYTTPLLCTLSLSHNMLLLSWITLNNPTNLFFVLCFYILCAPNTSSPPYLCMLFTITT